jgi:thymidylate synthase ThyX
MHHPAYTFLKRLSHTADSQDQRHRMVPASRPLLTLTDTRQPDFVTPPLVAANAEAREVYEEAMARAWAAKNRLLEMGVPLEQALYLLPNAKALRFHESGSLLYLAHKWVMRTCFNAQDEIYRASMEELEQVRAVHPRLARHMGPPCVLRHGHVTPTCTEGEHFCGVPVWRSFPNVTRPL